MFKNCYRPGCHFDMNRCGNCNCWDNNYNNYHNRGFKCCFPIEITFNCNRRNDKDYDRNNDCDKKDFDRRDFGNYNYENENYNNGYGYENNQNGDFNGFQNNQFGGNYQFYDFNQEQRGYGNQNCHDKDDFGYGKDDCDGKNHQEWDRDRDCKHDWNNGDRDCHKRDDRDCHNRCNNRNCQRNNRCCLGLLAGCLFGCRNFNQNR